MSFSRESDGSGSDSEAEDEKFCPSFLIALLIHLQQASAEIILNFACTSRVNHLFVLIWLTEHLFALNNSDNNSMLIFLEKLMRADDEKAKALAESVLINLNVLPVENPINEPVIQRLLAATRKNDCKGELRERRYYHEVALAGNYKLLAACQNVGFFASNASGKVSQSLAKALVLNDETKTENYKETLRLVMEYKLKNK